MPGRILCSDSEAEDRGFIGHECQRRRAVLRESLEAFAGADTWHRLAARNLARWREGATESPNALRVEILPGDWGEVTRSLTEKYGECFAVLNMANAHVPGGAYVEGTVAQEENMFRRADTNLSGAVDFDEYKCTLHCVRACDVILLMHCCQVHARRSVAGRAGNASRRRSIIGAYRSCCRITVFSSS